MAQTIIPAETNGIRDKAAIVGIGETEFSWNSGRSEIQLAAEAIKAACDDAGIAPQDIDGLVRYEMDSNHETLLVQTLGIKNLRHWESVAYGGGAGNAVVGHAAAAIAAGFCNYVVCFRAANLRSGLRLGQARGPERIAGGETSFAAPWGSMAPAHSFGMFVRRYMHQYGATSRHFGWVAVTLREHASRNPRALRKDPITIDDHQNSRMVVDPLHVLDFCQENDGAAAIIMTTPERAKELRHSDTLTLVEAAAQGSGPRNSGHHVPSRPDRGRVDEHRPRLVEPGRSGSEGYGRLDVLRPFHPFLPVQPGSLRLCAPRRGQGLRGRGTKPPVRWSAAD